MNTTPATDKVLQEALQLVYIRHKAARRVNSAKGGRKGGRARTEAKIKASLANLAKANKARTLKREAAHEAL